MSSHEHVPYFPARRDNDDAELHIPKLSMREERLRQHAQMADSTFHGGGSAYEQTIHSSFDYKNNPLDSHDGYKHSQTTKDGLIHHQPVHSHDLHHNQVVPTPADVLYMHDVEEGGLTERSGSESHRNKSHSHHHKDQGHFGGKTQHHTVVHVDDPNAQAIIAHNHAIDVHAPTVMHAVDDGICSARCAVGSVAIVCVLGMIVVIYMFSGATN